MSNAEAQDRIVAGNPDSDMLAAYRADVSELERFYRPTLKHAEALTKLADAHGVPSLIAHLPMAFQLSGEEWKIGRRAYSLEARAYPGGEKGVVSEFCASAHLECAFSDDFLRSKLQEADGSHLYFDYDFHLNPAGNQVVGQWLAETIQDRFKAVLVSRGSPSVPGDLK